MKFISIEILKGTIIVLLIYFGSYLFVSFTKSKLLWHQKNLVNTEALARLIAMAYFIINLIVLFYDLIEYDEDPEGYSFVLWLIFIIPLTRIFMKLHIKLTKIDTNSGKI